MNDFEFLAKHYQHQSDMLENEHQLMKMYVNLLKTKDIEPSKVLELMERTLKNTDTMLRDNIIKVI